MIAKYKELSDILAGIGINAEMRDAVVEYADWTYGDTDIVLVRANKVKRVLIDFVESGMVDEYNDYNELTLDVRELKYNIKDVFDSVESDYYIDITN